MQAGVCLRQDTETTRPELTEQHRIRLKEEELHRLESVDMAESETECAAPGLNTLEPECVTAHSGVSDVHHTHTSLIKTESDLGSTHTGNLIKSESRDSTELGYITHLHPDQIKTKADDGGSRKCLSSKDNLNTHQRIHRTEKPHRCTLCGKCFTQKSHMNIHRRIHTGEKPYKCALCGKCFSQSSALNRHQVIHSGVQSYKCLQCEKSFSQRGSVNVHQRTNTCAAPGLNTLEPECVTAHSGVSDVHNTHTSLIKTETDLGSTHTGNLIKSESQDSPELGYVTHLHPDQIKRKADDGGYLKAEHISDLQDIKCVEINSDSEFMKNCFSGISSLSRNLTIHRGIKPHKCTVCGKCLSSKDYLNTHQRIHRTEKPHKCTLCGRCFTQKSHMNIHRRIHTGEKPYKCALCGKCFSQSSALNRHQVIHSGVQPYKCFRCEKSFSRRGSLNVHQRTHTCASQALNRLEPECVTAHSGVSDVHHTDTSLIKTETDLDSTHTGDLIKTENLDSTELGYVTHLHPDQIKTEADDGGYLKAEHTSVLQDIKCVEMTSDLKCMKKCFVVISRLNGHHRMHRGEEPNKCLHCGMCFSQTRYLNLHQRIHTGEKPSKCTHCAKCFTQKSNLNIHQRIHTDEKSCKYTMRGKCLSGKSSLNSHQRIRTTEKPHKCTLCGNGFSRKYHLNIHQRVHTGEKPYECTLCGKYFAQKSNLKIHQWIHTGEKPYKCTWCGQCFAIKSYLNVHQRSHSGEKPHKCTHCGKFFSAKSSLNTHQRKYCREKPYK